MKLQIRYAYFSHIGKLRQINQDNYLCLGKYHALDAPALNTPVTGTVRINHDPVFGVFDGLGGEEKGEVAAFLAAKTASELLCGESRCEEMNRYCYEANRRIWDYRSAHGVSRMATTVALLSFAGDMVYLCNIGDTRIYRFDGNDLRQLSQDHVIAPFPGMKGPLTQALGISPEATALEPYFAKGKSFPGEKYLLCSDGLTDMLTEDEMTRILRANDVCGAVTKLTEAAIHHGGRDNITLSLCAVEIAEGR